MTDEEIVAAAIHFGLDGTGDPDDKCCNPDYIAFARAMEAKVRAEMADMVTLTRAEHDELETRSYTLAMLEGAGVDNWEGYSAALEDLDLAEKPK